MSDENPRKYLLMFAQVLEEFQMPELEALLELFECTAQIEPLPSTHLECPVAILKGSNDAEVTAVLSRSMLVKHGYEIIVAAEDYGQLHEQFRQRWIANPECYFVDKQSYCFRVKSIGRKTKQNYALQRIQEFEYMPVRDAPVQLDRPDVEYHLIEFYGKSTLQQKDAVPAYVYLARLIGCGQYHLAEQYSIRQRLYIGNTTMDPRAALLQVNLAHVKPHSLVLDPFAGTGGILLMAGHFGGVCLGAEINWSIAHGVGKSSRVTEGELRPEQCMRGNFAESGLAHRFLGVVLADTSKHSMWRQSLLFDAVVCDPPYGLREKCQKIGVKALKPGWIEKEQLEGEQIMNHYPQKTAYKLADVFIDLVSFAADRLNVGGRLAYWLPCTADDYTPASVPTHPCMRLVANCEQGLCARTSRRLIVMQKERNVTEQDSVRVVDNVHERVSYRDTALRLN